MEPIDIEEIIVELEGEYELDALLSELLKYKSGKYTSYRCSLQSYGSDGEYGAYGVLVIKGVRKETPEELKERIEKRIQE